MMSYRLLAVALCAGVASGCATPDDKWENPSASQASWEVHQGECRRLANQQAEREYVYVEPGIGETFGRQSTLRTNVARYDAAQRREYLYDRCMKDRGFKRPSDGK